mgnify:CR=1 FL=1
MKFLHGTNKENRLNYRDLKPQTGEILFLPFNFHWGVETQPHVDIWKQCRLNMHPAMHKWAGLQLQ